ncbi:MAG TPA: transposase [Bryobacteraceae bacterium]|nr:transposase [Bryobacteraceae bacterium]
MQALRGVTQTTAAPIVSELGSLSRFENPRQLMGYSGLVARENSSGNRIQRGSITKTGNAHLRRVVMEAAWAYQHRPNVTGFLLLGRNCSASSGRLPGNRKAAQTHGSSLVESSMFFWTAAPITTVLAGKGSLRRAQKRRALVRCAPLWPGHLCDGRFRREHFVEAWAEKGKGRTSSCGRNPA